MSERRPPFWLWPNLLSLDAPLVAVVWLYMFAKTWRVDYHEGVSYVALALAVWVIYVVDRLIDLKVRRPDDPLLGERHRFHQRHRWVFLGGVVVALGVLGWMVFTQLPVEVLAYGRVGMVPVMIFFAMVVFAPATREIPHFRNVVAGMAFAYGTAMMAHVYLPTEGIISMIASREMICFGFLCVLNISAIHLWEHAWRSDDPETQAADELSLTLPLTVLAACALIFALMDNHSIAFLGSNGGFPTRPFFYAVLVSAALLQVLNRNRNRFSLDALRSLADAAMIAPFPFFLILSGH